MWALEARVETVLETGVLLERGVRYLDGDLWETGLGLDEDVLEGDELDTVVTGVLWETGSVLDGVVEREGKLCW